MNCKHCNKPLSEPNYRKRPFCDYICDRQHDFEQRFNGLMTALLKYFRVWDAEKKIMFSHDWLYSACVQYGALVNNPRKAINTMQFTGLLDKNGKEIYEGDIVQRGVILFGNGKFQGYYYESNGGIAEAWEDDLCKERNIEVLGNMYENPELMKSDF